MSGNRKLQVFISSTFEDMQGERAAAVNAVLSSGHIPAGMELFSAGDETQLETIYRWIEDSDIYLIILGGRYGTVEPKSGLSYTELEYLHAVKTGTPYFALVITDDALDQKVRLHGRKVDEKENTSLLLDFRTRVLSKTSSLYNDAKDIKLAVMQSLNQLSRDETLIGWVRADSVNSIEILEENRSLRQKIEDVDREWQELEQKLVLPPIPELTDNVNLRFLKHSEGYGDPTFELEIQISWMDAFSYFHSSANFYLGDWGGESSFSINLDESGKALARSILNDLQGYAVPKVYLNENDVRRLHAYYVEADFVENGSGDEIFTDTGNSFARRMTLANFDIKASVLVISGKLPISDEIPF